jgi:anti-sigma regulatory factor (Ser/Thr protein kinase)
MILRMTLNLPGEAAGVSLVRCLASTLMEQFGIESEDVDTANLVIGEVCGNVVRHAGLGPRSRYQVDFEFCLDYLVISVTDGGRGFDRSAVPAPSLDRSNGWGLWLVENLAESVEFQPAGEGGATVRARLAVQYRTPQARAEAERLAGVG